VRGLLLSEVRNAVEDGRAHGVVVAALHNARDIVVLSGEVAAVDAAAAAAHRAGARSTTRLRVSHAFHSPLMAPAADGWAQAVGSTPLRDAIVPVVPDTNPAPTRAAAVLRRALIDQLTGIVRWHEVMDALESAGVDHVVEVGTSRTLAGLWRLDGRRSPVESTGDRRTRLLARSGR